MAKLLEKFPLIHLWDWADGNKYTIDDDNTVLTPELAESDKKIDEDYEKHFKKEAKGNAGKGKSQFKEKNKVAQEQLNMEEVEKAPEKIEKQSTEKEIGD